MIKNSQNPLLIALLSPLCILFLCNPAFSFEKPEVVRIAGIASNQGGKSVISGGQSAVISAKGWLEDDLKKIGVKLEWFPVPATVGGPLFNEALANRSADFANYGDFPALIAKAGGIDIKLIVPAGRGTNSYLVTAANSSAQSIKDLKGKRFATLLGTPENVVLRDYEGDADSWKDRFSPLFDPLTIEHYRDAAEFTRAQNLIGKTVDVNGLIDTRFLDTALKELHLENYWVPRIK